MSALPSVVDMGGGRCAQDYLGSWKTLHRLCTVHELTVCLDRREADGRIEAYQGAPRPMARTRRPRG